VLETQSHLTHLVNARMNQLTGQAPTPMAMVASHSFQSRGTVCTRGVGHRQVRL
jgi:hypothetical protein